MKIETLKLRPILAIGYWKDTYTEEENGINGYCHHVFFLFWHYQLAHLQKPEGKTLTVERKKKRSGFQQRLEDALLGKTKTHG